MRRSSSSIAEVEQNTRYIWKSGIRDGMLAAAAARAECAETHESGTDQAQRGRLGDCSRGDNCDRTIDERSDRDRVAVGIGKECLRRPLVKLHWDRTRC